MEVLVENNICPICNNDGYVTEDRDGAKEFIGFCSCAVGKAKKTEMWQQKLTEAGILEEYWPLKFSNFIPQNTFVSHMQFLKALETYMLTIHAKRTEGGIWLILGTAGTGKTLGASLVLKEALKKDYTCRYEVWGEIIDEAFLPVTEQDAQLQHRHKTVDFLVIDDLGKDKIMKDSDFKKNLLEKLLKHRFSKKLPTILISTLDMAELYHKFPVLASMIAPTNISRVQGINFRTSIDLRRP
jgi:DNA replication protein DnaC